MEIRLPRGNWQFDENAPLGPAGGFGQVFEGTDLRSRVLAIKRLHLDANAAGHRELDIADLLAGRDLQHVVPVLDAGVDADTGRIFVVMERADRSLREDLARVGQLAEAVTIDILEAIALGLQELEVLVHRDLKPDNVLLHDGHWKLADFGIARFVEDSTSPHTLKFSLTPAYAAPEQWRGEHATHATDIYALGCIAYELLTGGPPFDATSRDEYMRQHLHEPAPQVQASAAIRLLIQTCLRKPQQARPTLNGFLSRLASANAERQAGTHAVQMAAAVVEAADASREADAARRERLAKEREELAEAGLGELDSLMDELFSRVLDAAQGKAIETPAGSGRNFGRQVSMGHGVLRYYVPFPILTKGDFVNSDLDIAAGAVIRVEQEGHRYCAGRGANLWYGDFDKSGSFSWWEQAYMTMAWLPQQRLDEPFGVDNHQDLRRADEAHSMMASLQRASKLRRIEGDELNAFCTRWTERFSRTATRSLERPSSMPDEEI